MTGKAVATAKTTAVTNYDYGDDAGEGFEDVKSSDLSIPFLSLMQSNSVLVEDDSNEIKAGDIVNSVTGEVMKQPIIIHPCHKDHIWAEWHSRNSAESGRGESHEDGSQVVRDIIEANNGSRIPPKDADNKRNPFKAPNGMDLIETFYYYVMIMDADGKTHEGFAVLPFSSTKIKIQKDWTSSMYMIKGRPPLVAHRATLTSIKQNANGKNFYNFSIRPFGESWRDGLIAPDEEGMTLMGEARDFKNMILSGSASAATQTEDNSEGVTSGKGQTSGSKSDDDEIPF